MIKELNHKLSIKLKNNFEKALENIKNFESKFKEVNEAIELAKSFDLNKFQNNSSNRLFNTLIQEWEKYQKNVEAKQFDMIYFEYHEQSIDFTEAYSYGIYNMKNFKLTLEPHYYDYDYSFENWEAGLGLILESFYIKQPIEESENFDEVSENIESGYNQLSQFITALNEYIFNLVFKHADEQELFKNLRIKQGGIFMLDIHDGGNVQSPFYFKA